MFSITNHAIDRYIERVLQIDLNKEEKEDFLREAGADICKTVAQMIRDSDIIVSDNNIYYVLYRDVAIIIKDNDVVTLYKIHQDIDDYIKYIETITMYKEIIEEVILKREKARFYDSEKQKLYNKRISQYVNFLFRNELAKEE